MYLRCCLMVLTLALPWAAQAKGLPSTNVAWRSAASEADIERDFALARAEHKPVLLYWGATWCPPCNQLKATLFSRQDFALLARSFVPVFIDGDLPGAQKLGQRFKVSGYPTTVLFNEQRAEITRLPGEVDAPQALELLKAGLAGGRPVRAVLADALAGKTLGADEWRALAYYSWDTDDGQLVAPADLASTLVRLAVACPAAESETRNRLWLKAIAASDDGQGVRVDAPLRERMLAVLADAGQSRALMDVLTNSPTEIVHALVEGDAAHEAAIVARYDTALRRLQADATLSRADRLGALAARVELARLDQPKDAVEVRLPAALRAELQAQVGRDDAEISDAYERQAVITEAAYALGRAGLWKESDALLKANLARSHSPYYLMSQLAGNARKLGHKDEALSWYAQAYAKSVGAATRLQWGSSYLAALVDLAPQDSARIEQTASQLLADAARDSGSFEGRSVRALQRAGAKLASWNAGGRHAPALRRLQARLDGVCAQAESAQRAACRTLFKPAAG
ncbi:MAG: thioredoxin family protein [Burkholderiales bacterium]|nr:thioredoxin family protein [Burkholderiales bacterium]MDE1926107.1 thioredoxin family protein [Burkholderiales bacterium]MDE2159489.1 thioredoxin family protein [Burkholderiales bacterium]MDE2504764.1 thioredoxin family protein [Burkholderiales bacterium]